MLVLSRFRDEEIILTLPDDSQISIIVTDIRDNKKVRLGITAPADVGVDRREVIDAIHRGEKPRHASPRALQRRKT